MPRRHLTVVLAALCLVLLVSARRRPVRAEVPTFNREVVRIFQQHCQSCHRPGDIAPFSLLDYESARPKASRIRAMTQARLMPPWKPDDCADFRGKRRLSDADIATLARWADGGAPEGNPADLPPPVVFGDDWPLGRPDIELQLPEPFTAAAGADTYRCFSIPAGNSSQLAVSAFDTRPGNRAIVHHVLAFIDTSGESVRLDNAEAGPGYTCFGGPGFTPAGALGGWAPGMRTEPFPDGIATQLPANARVVLQVHYHPQGNRVDPDQTRVAIYLSRKPVQKWLRVLPLANTGFVIPPGASSHTVTATMQVPAIMPVHLWAIAPHMHLLGRSIKVDAFKPDGSLQCLVNIPDWDFNWQNQYLYRNPVPLPGGTIVTLEAKYDNSANNPRNPNSPPKEVRWGEATTDEMCLAFLAVTLDAENVASGNEYPAGSAWIE